MDLALRCGDHESLPCSPAAPKSLQLVRLEQWAIERALLVARGNKSEAARLLGIGRRTLYSKLGTPPPADG